MIFDSTTFYHGNYGGLTAYSMQTGISRWTYSWLAFNDALGYREPAFKDSLLFLTAPTSVWDHAYLYCLNKKTGITYWRKVLDAGYVSIQFNTTPMVIGDNVIVLTRDADNHKHLTAFKSTDGSQAWTTPANDSLTLQLKLINGNIYSVSDTYVSCYNGNDGSLKWQTDLQINNFTMTSVFQEQDNLVLVKVNGKDYTIIKINTITGVVSNRSTITVPSDVTDPKYAPLSCNYKNNILFLSTHHNFDTVSIRAYDLNSMSMKWEKLFAHYGFAELNTLLTNKYLLVPINNSYPEGKTIMYFLDFNGKQVSRVPYNTNYTDRFAYVENGIIYNMDNYYIPR
jgi:hypothetical protein